MLQNKNNRMLSCGLLYRTQEPLKSVAAKAEVWKEGDVPKKKCHQVHWCML